VSVLPFSTVAYFAPIRWCCLCLAIMALLVLAYSARNHHAFCVFC
jgi:hypothetical protein